MKSPQAVADARRPQTVQDSRVRAIAIWFYVIAGLQVFSAITAWQSGAGAAASIGAAFAVVDLIIGVAYVVLGYFAAKRQSWAFVAGLILYVVRTVANLMQFFSPITLIIRLYLTFRMWQGLQACLAANRADQAMAMLNQRRLVMPTSSPAAAAQAPAPPAQPWRPPTADAELPAAQPWRPPLSAEPNPESP